MLSTEQSLGYPQISLKNAALTYAGAKSPAFQVADLSISSSECVLVTGRSGAGKSTFLRLISGLLPDEESRLVGTVEVGNCRAGQETTAAFARQVASTFQEPARQFFHQKVKHELVFPAENQGLSAELIQKRLTEVAAAFDLTHLLERDCLALSGGEQQRVAMAVAVMQDTPVIILDEPTSHLDAASIAQLRSQITKLKKLVRPFSLQSTCWRIFWTWLTVCFMWTRANCSMIGQQVSYKHCRLKKGNNWAYASWTCLLVKLSLSKKVKTGHLASRQIC